MTDSNIKKMLDRYQKSKIQEQTKIREILQQTQRPSHKLPNLCMFQGITSRKLNDTLKKIGLSLLCFAVVLLSGGAVFQYLSTKLHEYSWW